MGCVEKSYTLKLDSNTNHVLCDKTLVGSLKLKIVQQSVWNLIQRLQKHVFIFIRFKFFVSFFTLWQHFS